MEEPLFRNMINILEHRGPDAQGCHLEHNFGLGIRRLSIIDLSPNANQPFYNEDRSILSVCNGEIYNYQELREDLLSKGHRFETQCDVEVLVHLYEEHGLDFLHLLNGQFALALFDKKRQTLFLARDHVGITPLFYTCVQNAILFASEIKALLQHPRVPREVDLTGLDQVFSFPGIVSPRTLFKHIQALKPGHWVKVSPGELKVQEYWDLVYPEASDIDDSQPESYYIETLEEHLREAVRYRLQADVPVGLYVSGGLDSALVSGITHSLSPEAKRHAFSIGFTQSEIDERPYQKRIAQEFGFVHHEKVFDWQDIILGLKEMIYRAECPLKESYDTCSLALSASVHQQGMKVVLTGEGADELFAGYLGYRFDAQRQRGGSELPDLEQMLEQEIRENLWGTPDFVYEYNQYELRETKQMLYSPEVNQQFPAFECLNHELLDKRKLHNRHRVHQRSYVDFKLRLADQLLADHGDRVAYANSVEARYPFLDINVVEFVKTIPPRWLLKDAVEKYILRQVAQKYVPPAIHQREKFAFVAPGSPFLIRSQHEWIQDLLSYETIKQAGYFNPDTVERLKQIYSAPDFTINQTLNNDLLMIVLTFSIFLDLFNMPPYSG